MIPMKNKTNDVVAISSEALKEFQEATPKIIAETVSRSLKCKEDISQHGGDAEKIITSGIEFTSKMLESAMVMGEIPLLEDELSWAKDRLSHDGVEMEHVLKRFKIYKDVINEILSKESAIEVNHFINWMINHQTKIMQRK